MESLIPASRRSEDEKHASDDHGLSMSEDGYSTPLFKSPQYPRPSAPNAHTPSKDTTKRAHSTPGNDPFATPLNVGLPRFEDNIAANLDTIQGEEEHLKGVYAGQGTFGPALGQTMTTPGRRVVSGDTTTPPATNETAQSRVSRSASGASSLPASSVVTLTRSTSQRRKPVPSFGDALRAELEMEEVAKQAKNSPENKVAAGSESGSGRGRSAKAARSQTKTNHSSSTMQPSEFGARDQKRKYTLGVDMPQATSTAR